MKSTKCSSCGANIKIDDEKEVAVCPYCGTSYIMEKNEKAKQTNNNEPFNFDITEENAKYFQGKRPKISIILAIILFSISFFPGIIYVAIVFSLQQKWDEYNINNKNKNTKP